MTRSVTFLSSLALRTQRQAQTQFAPAVISVSERGLSHAHGEAPLHAVACGGVSSGSGSGLGLGRGMDLASCLSFSTRGAAMGFNLHRHSTQPGGYAAAHEPDRSLTGGVCRKLCYEL